MLARVDTGKACARVSFARFFKLLAGGFVARAVSLCSNTVCATVSI